MVLVSMHEEPRFNHESSRSWMQPECVDETTSVEKAAMQMIRGHLPFLQVVDAHGHKAGELTRDDLLRYLLVSLRRNPDAYTDSLKKVLMVCAPPTGSTADH